MKYLPLILLAPFLAVVLIALICALTVVSPLILIAFLFINKKRQARRQSAKHPLMTILNNMPKSAQ
ncbi:MAG: hypothetical protein RLZZ236_1947 [Bacteroidota bacterium]|jgi:hypothetical protein